MKAQLRRLGPKSKIQILKIPKECRTKIWLAGRGTCCQIYTKSKYASRQHFSITYRDQKYFISDLQSANGTFLNDEKITNEKLLTFGNTISVGVPSQMQSSPDCIVYIFESYPDECLAEKELPNPENKIETPLQKNSSIELNPAPKIQNVAVADEKPKESELDIHKPDNNLEQNPLNDSSSSDVVIIEVIGESEKTFINSVDDPVPAKRIKLEQNSLTDNEKWAEPEGSGQKPEEINIEDEDMSAYEALTQVDEPEVKSESELLNYSLTEELIEISDSEVEGDWTPCVKQEGSKSPEGGDEDDDVVLLETIIRKPYKNDLPPVEYKGGDDLGEVDLKWMGKLFKLKREVETDCAVGEPMEGIECDKQNEVTQEPEKPTEGAPTEPTEGAPAEPTEGAPAEPTEGEPTEVESSVIDDINRLSTEDPPSENEAVNLPRVEVPQTTVKRVIPKKTVRFNMVPEIRYIEVPSRTRLSPSEIGRMRFTRIIFNICSWNTHWLEECKRVAPDKDPPGICEERLRKIPKKFLCHSDYMKAFIPAMLLHLWNRIKEKWVASADSGFRQTVSCDSCEDYQSENLSVYKCTGLVQNVNAHKQLIREGHLVLLRLHQIQLSQFPTPAAQKYSKKLGYLVFGVIERKTYERFHNQPLHQCLAERSASVVGDLHIVRFNILVKKRPNFQLDKRTLIQLTVVQQITQELRLFKGICFLPDSPLCAAILKPSKVETLLPEPQDQALVFKGPLDDFQKEVVGKLSHACFSNSSLLYSVFGAAGTGKGQVIVALILQLLFGGEWKRKRPKIIYCTQWSVPLDEMAVKLKNYKQNADESFSLVRVGPIREVKPEVRDLCVSNLASNLNNSNKRGFGPKNFDAEIEVIEKADVILTTCISTGVSKMCSAFEKMLLKERDRKVICVIDEAMSCREADCVVPLLLGVTHLILVGDTYQLEPTFSGEKTKSLGLDMPLFWRIYKNFINIPKESWPIFILRTQYRMLSSLSNFISRLIYKTPLMEPSISVGCRIGNIRSHLLLVDRVSENVVKGEKEASEIRMVSEFTKAIAGLARLDGKNDSAIAVIMCDAKQTESLRLLLPRKDFPEVEVEKIHAFQGREFDLVVFFYDGRKILTSWVATAVTRAKRGLFIIASEQSIEGNSLFKKMSENAVKLKCLKYIHPDMSVKEFEGIATSAT